MKMSLWCAGYLNEAISTSLPRTSFKEGKEPGGLTYISLREFVSWDVQFLFPLVCFLPPWQSFPFGWCNNLSSQGLGP